MDRREHGGGGRKERGRRGIVEGWLIGYRREGRESLGPVTVPVSVAVSASMVWISGIIVGHERVGAGKCWIAVLGWEAVVGVVLSVGRLLLLEMLMWLMVVSGIVSGAVVVGWSVVEEGGDVHGRGEKRHSTKLIACPCERRLVHPSQIRHLKKQRVPLIWRTSLPRYSITCIRDTAI